MVGMMSYSLNSRIFSSRNSSSSRNNRSKDSFKNNIYSKDSTSSRSVLNKAPSVKVLGFVKDVSSSVNGFRTALTNLSTDISTFDRSGEFSSYDETKLNRDLESLTNSFNSIRNLVDENKSKMSTEKIEELESKIEDVYFGFEKDFEKLGLKYENNRFYKEEDLEREYFLDNISSYKDKIDELNDATSEFLKVPMSNFLEFKSFDLYFNYNLKNTAKDSFKLIEEGSILDIAV
ncbi:MAG: hypothetical protein ACK5LV_07505 [Lachnospirales bacterium]